MKKILFRKLLSDCLIFFIISLISASIIIWVFQAVNFLDIIIEDGQNYSVYISYTLLNLPKIISKILPFAFFFSFTYTFVRYELNNELVIFWNIGINKIKLINFFLLFSIVLIIIQIILTSYIVPNAQKLGRNLIGSSNINGFENLIKPKKFNDVAKNLTIYVDKKNNDESFENIYLKKESKNNSYQITYAKRGAFEKKGNQNILVLYNGETINSINGKISKFKFSKSDLNLNDLTSHIIASLKIQEVSSVNIFMCIKKILDIEKRVLTDLIKLYPNCSLENLDNNFKELYKRFIIPFYIPLLILISLLAIFKSKEDSSYNTLRSVTYIFGLAILIISETTIRFIGNELLQNIKFIFIPLFLIITVYLFYIYNFVFKIRKYQK